MRGRTLAWMILGLGLLFPPATAEGQGSSTPDQIVPTDQIHVLRAQNLQLRQALLQRQVEDLQRQIAEASKALDAEWAVLEADLRKVLTVPADWTWDRARAAFVPSVKKANPTP
jgi:hypothetical protein